MTQAAKELHLTQSGVSQQIKSLEETLNIPLFDRINRRIIPTSEADILYRECSRRLTDLEKALQQISNHDSEIRGRIRIGFPPIFGHHTLVPLLSEFARNHPMISFDLRMGLASEVIPALTQGNLDFAFVDAYATDSHLVNQDVAEQTLTMVSHTALFKEPTPQRFSYESFSQLPYVAYTENQAMLKSWFRANFGQIPYELNVRATIMDCNTAALLVSDGVGAALLPDSVVESASAQSSQLFHPTEQKAVKNTISICRLAKRTMGAAAEECYNWLCHKLNP
jgi:DNA-binding transcriptional LysR family regulator